MPNGNKPLPSDADASGPPRHKVCSMTALLRGDSSTAFPNTTRMPAHTIQAERLMAKYGTIWLHKVFPDGTIHSRSSEDKQVCSLKRILLHGDQDVSEVLGSDSLRKLEPGARLIAALPPSINPSFAAPLHPAFPKDCWFLPVQTQHWSNNLDDFLVASFVRPTRVFILLPSLMTEPRWLRASFFKLKDPNLSEVHLKVKWRTVFGMRLMLGMAGMLDRFKQQTLRVFKSKQVYHRGEQLVIGGMGLGGIVELGFAVAFKEEAQADGEGLRSVPHYSHPGSVISEPFDFESWLQRLIRIIKKGRVVDARLMIETDLARPAHLSYLAQYDINVLPEDEDELLLVDLPAAAKNVKMVCLLVDRCNCVLSPKALQLIVHHWEEVPALSGTALGLLLHYLQHHPNPLSITSAYLMVLKGEMRMRSKKRPTTALEEALLKFQALQAVLVRRCQDLLRESPAEQHLKVMQLESLLDPKPPLQRPSSASSATQGSGPGPIRPASLPPIMTLSCFKPLRVAFYNEDAEFMSFPMVEEFTRHVWRGADFVLETCKDGQYTLSLLDPGILFVVLCNLGFCTQQMVTLEWSARLWHLSTYSSQAFFNSPRARWLMRSLSNATFIILYLQVIYSSLIPNWFGEEGGSTASREPSHIRNVNINIVLFNSWILGNVVEVVQVIMLRHRSNPLQYILKHQTEVAFTLVDIFMVVTSTLYCLSLNEMVQIHPSILARLTMSWAAMAPLLWGQALFPLIPLLDNLGPMLRTLSVMIGELLMFLIPWTLITAGFSVALSVVFDPLDISQLANFWSAMFVLFRGFSTGGPDYTIFDKLDDFEGTMPADLIESYRLFGYFVFIAYTVVSSIVLGNLLIAIITNRYRPDNVRAQSNLSFAEYVDIHQFQVQHNLLCSPFNLIPLFFIVLPSGLRKKVHPVKFYRLALAFLDGFVPATPSSMYLAYGRCEIPHLIYLLTIPPAMTLLGGALFALHLPISALYFASTGHKKVVTAMKAFTAGSFGSQSGGGPLGPRSSASMSAGSSNGGGASSGAAGDMSRASTLTASNDEFEVFGGPPRTPDKPPSSLAMTLLGGAWSTIHFLVWLVVGTITLLGLLIINFVLYSGYVWLAAVAWSLYNILWGSLVLWGQRAWRDPRGRGSVCAAAQRCGDGDGFCAQQQQRASIIKVQEDRQSMTSLFQNLDIADCVQEVFGIALAPGPELSEAGAGQGEAPAATASASKAALSWRKAGVLGMTSSALAGAASRRRNSSTGQGAAAYAPALGRRHGSVDDGRPAHGVGNAMMLLMHKSLGKPAKEGEVVEAGKGGAAQQQQQAEAGSAAQSQALVAGPRSPFFHPAGMAAASPAPEAADSLRDDVLQLKAAMLGVQASVAALVQQLQLQGQRAVHAAGGAEAEPEDPRRSLDLTQLLGSLQASDPQGSPNRLLVAPAKLPQDE